MHAEVAARGCRRQGMLRLGVRNHRPALDRGQDCFPRASFRAWMFSAWSATIRFRRRFSTSRAQSCWS
jgi:hypothetical protein